jgi:hypothetical protein
LQIGRTFWKSVKENESGRTMEKEQCLTGGRVMQATDWAG